MEQAIAYGDCNTEGLRGEVFPLWAEIVCEALSFELTNCGHTMSTSRELVQYNAAFPASGYSLAFIQYGLVDSWLTFKGAPYVLYYPDSFRRKLTRKLVKKLKKWARHLNLQKRLGAVEQVPLDEYIANIRWVLRQAPERRFVLVATAPNRDSPRNPRIRKYNQALELLAEKEPNAVYADAWNDLWPNPETCLMEDGTHLTARGHQLVADRVLAVLRQTSL